MANLISILAAFLLVNGTAHSMDMHQIVSAFDGGDNLLCRCPAELIALINFHAVPRKFDFAASEKFKEIIRDNNDAEIYVYLSQHAPNICLNSVVFVEKSDDSYPCKFLCAFDIAKSNNNTAVVDMLSHLGAKSYQSFVSLCELEDFEKQEERNWDNLSVHFLARCDRGDLVVWFLSMYPNVDVNFVLDRKSLLDWSVCRRDEHTTRYLMSRGAALCALSQDQLLMMLPETFFCKPIDAEAAQLELNKFQNENPLDETSRTLELPFPKSACINRLALWAAAPANDVALANELVNGDFGVLVQEKNRERVWTNYLSVESINEIKEAIKSSIAHDKLLDH